MLKKPEVHVENILKLANFVESLPTVEKVVIHRDANVLRRGVRLKGFSMKFCLGESEDCATVGCICGCVNSLFGESYPSQLGLTREQFNSLYYAAMRNKDGYFYETYLTKNWTSADAAKVLRHLAITGEVDWSITGK